MTVINRSALETALATRQPLDADLTALAALPAPATKLAGIEAYIDTLRSPIPAGDVITTPAGFTTLPRHMATGSWTGTVGATGNMRIGHFRAALAGSRSNIHVVCAGTPSTTPTLIRFAIWRVESNGDYTLLATTPNDTALLAAAGTAYSKALSAPVVFVAGQEYALGTLIIQPSGTAPAIYSMPGAPSAELLLPPRVSGVINGLSDLPSAVVNGGAGNLLAATPTATSVGVTYARFS